MNGPRVRFVGLSGILFGLLATSSALFCQERTNEETAFDGSTISLPPFYVEPANAPAWLLVSGPGFELLTTHDRGFAREFAQRYYEQVRLVETFVPSRYHWKPHLPDTVIVVDRESHRQETDEALGQVLEQNRKMHEKLNQRGRFLPNLRLTSADSSTVFAFLNSEFLGRSSDRRPFEQAALDAGRFGGRKQGFHFTPNRLLHQLNNQAVPLPAWAITGLIRLYINSTIEAREMTIAPLAFTTTFVAPPPPTETDVPSPEEPPEPDDQRPLDPPAPEINFALSSTLTVPPVATSSERIHWEESCELLVHWALFAEDGIYADSFWDFIDQRESRLLDEKLFVEKFGFDFSEAEARVASHLEVASKKRQRVRSARGALPKYTVARAKPGDVARIISEWERLETEFVRRSHPEFLEVYLSRARATIASAMQNGNSSPELLATSGLFEFDAGNLGDAYVDLKQSIELGVGRPLVLRRFAQVKFERLQTRASSDASDSAELKSIHSLLIRAHETSPANSATYHQLAEFWAANESSPTKQDIAMLAAGVRQFPQNYPLVINMVNFQADRGQIRSALQILDYAAARSQSEKTTAAYASFRERLIEAYNEALTNP